MEFPYTSVYKCFIIKIQTIGDKVYLKFKSNFRNFLSNIFSMQSQKLLLRHSHKLQRRYICHTVDQIFWPKIFSVGLIFVPAVPEWQKRPTSEQNVCHDVKPVQQLIAIQSNFTARKFGQLCQLVGQKFVDQFLSCGKLLFARDVPVNAEVVDVSGLAPFL